MDGSQQPGQNYNNMTSYYHHQGTSDNGDNGFRKDRGHGSRGSWKSKKRSQNSQNGAYYHGGGSLKSGNNFPNVANFQAIRNFSSTGYPQGGNNINATLHATAPSFVPSSAYSFALPLDLAMPPITGSTTYQSPVTKALNAAPSDIFTAPVPVPPQVTTNVAESSLQPFTRANPRLLGSPSPGPGFMSTLPSRTAPTSPAMRAHTPAGPPSFITNPHTPHDTPPRFTKSISDQKMSPNSPLTTISTTLPRKTLQSVIESHHQELMSHNRLRVVEHAKLGKHFAEYMAHELWHEKQKEKCFDAAVHYLELSTSLSSSSALTTSDNPQYVQQLGHVVVNSAVKTKEDVQCDCIVLMKKSQEHSIKAAEYRNHVEQTREKMVELKNKEFEAVVGVFESVCNEVKKALEVSAVKEEENKAAKMLSTANADQIDAKKPKSGKNKNKNRKQQHQRSNTGSTKSAEG